jgi:hypothetical protein
MNRMTTSTMNGMPRASMTQRKSLNQQLDRMDQILDGLSDALSAAVIDAVKDAVGVAVQVALREVLSNPELVARLAPVSASPAVAQIEPETAPTSTANRPSWTTRLWTKVRSIATGLWNRGYAFAGETGEAVKQAGHKAVRIGRICWTLVKFNVRTVVLALFIGVVAGTACYVAGPLVAAAVSGLVTGLLAGLARIFAPIGRMMTMDVEA